MPELMDVTAGHRIAFGRAIAVHDVRTHARAHPVGQRRRQFAANRQHDLEGTQESRRAFVVVEKFGHPRGRSHHALHVVQRQRLHGLGRIAAAHEDGAASSKHIDHPEIAAVGRHSHVEENSRAGWDPVSECEVVGLDAPQDNVATQGHGFLVAGSAGGQDDARRGAAVRVGLGSGRFAVALDPARINLNDAAGILEARRGIGENRLDAEAGRQVRIDGREGNDANTRQSQDKRPMKYRILGKNSDNIAALKSGRQGVRRHVVGERQQPAVTDDVVVPAGRTNRRRGRLMLGVEQKSVDDAHDTIIRNFAAALTPGATTVTPPIFGFERRFIDRMSALGHSLQSYSASGRPFVRC